MGTFPSDLNVFPCAYPGKQSWSGRVSGLNGWTRSNPIILFTREYIPMRWTSVPSSPGARACTCRWVPEVWPPVGGGSCRMSGCRMRGGLQQQLASRRWHFPRCPAYKAWNRGAVRKYFPLKKEGEREREVGGIQGASSMADSSGEYLIAQIRR